MANDERAAKPEAKGVATSKRMSAHAIGNDAASAVGNTFAIAEGRTVAALSPKGPAIARRQSTDEEIQAIRSQINEFATSFRVAIEACLRAAEAAEASGNVLAQTKETVDELWAAHAAVDLRKDSPMVGMAKSTLKAALSAGAGAEVL